METLQKAYGPRERLRTIVVHCGAHYGALCKCCGSLADHWNASKLLQFTMTHCGASSARCGGVHHTLTEMPKFHLPPPIVRLIHKSQPITAIAIIL